MGSRFEKTPKAVETFVGFVKKKFFPELANAEFLILFDKKKRVTFYEEIDLNKDDPDWRSRLHDIAQVAYDDKGRAIEIDPNQTTMFEKAG